jgi:hypothetical protein
MELKRYRSCQIPAATNKAQVDPSCVHHIMLALSGLDAIGYALLQQSIARPCLAKPVAKSSSYFFYPGSMPSSVFSTESKSSILIDASKQGVDVEDILFDFGSIKEWYVGPYSSW